MLVDVGLCVTVSFAPSLALALCLCPEGLEDALREGNLEVGNFCPDFLPKIEFRLLGRVQLYSLCGTSPILF